MYQLLTQCPLSPNYINLPNKRHPLNFALTNSHSFCTPFTTTNTHDNTNDWIALNLNQFSILYINTSKPGPASSVEECSICKIFVRGDRGSNLAEDLTFQSRKHE